MTLLLQLRSFDFVVSALFLFRLVPYYDDADVMNQASSLLIRGGDHASLSWDPSQLLPAAPANKFTLNIVMYSLPNPQTDSPSLWSNSSALALNIQNLGSVDVEIPTEQLSPLTDPGSQSPYSLVMFKVVFVPSPSSSDKYISSLGEASQSATTSAGLWSNIFFLVVRDESDYCDSWSTANDGDPSSYSPLLSGDCEGCVPSCPCNELQASLPNSGFVSMETSPGMSVLNRYLFPDSSACFTSAEPRFARLHRLPCNPQIHVVQNQIWCYNCSERNVLAADIVYYGT